MQTIYIFSYPLRTLGWWAIILLLDLDYNEIRFRCLSKVLPIRYVPSVQIHKTPHNRRIAKVTVHNWRKLWTETGMSGRNSSNFHAGRETVDTNNKKAMSETPRLRFCNTIYRLRAFSVLLENLCERAIWESARWAEVSTSEKSALSKISSKRKTPIQPDQSFLTWYERKWWVLVTILRKDYSGFHPENDWTSREFLLMESALGSAIKKQFHIFQFDLCTQTLKSNRGWQETTGRAS